MNPAADTVMISGDPQCDMGGSWATGKRGRVDDFVGDGVGGGVFDKVSEPSSVPVPDARCECDGDAFMDIDKESRRVGVVVTAVDAVSTVEFVFVGDLDGVGGGVTVCVKVSRVLVTERELLCESLMMDLERVCVRLSDLDE